MAVAEVSSDLTPSSPKPTLGQRAARGVFWTFTQVFGSKILVALAQVALGWLLVREDFGQIGLAFTVTTFINLLTSPGIDTVLVQRQRRIEKWITPAAWMSLTMGLLGCLITLAMAPVAAWFYNDPRVARLVMVLAFAAPASALAVTPRAMLEAQMRYRRIAAVTLTGTLVSSSLSVVLAYYGWGAYSLVIPVVASQLLMTSLYWWQVRPAIQWQPQLRRWRYMLGDTSYVFLSRLAITIVGQADYIVLGLMYAADVVGVYFFAFWYASQGTRLVGSAFSSSLFSAFAQLQNEPQRQVEAALKAARSIALLCVPICLLQTATARPLFHLLFGDRWNEAIPLVELLSLGFASDAVTWSGGALLQAQRRFGLLALLAFGFAGSFVALVTLGAYFGAAWGAALAVAGYYFFLSPIALYFTLRPSGVTWPVAMWVALPPWLIGFASFGFAKLLGLAAAEGLLGLDARLGWLASLSEFLVVVLVGGGLYLFLTRRFLPNDIALAWAKFRRKKALDNSPVNSHSTI